MKKLFFCLSLVGLVTLCLGGTALALSAPTVGVIIPASASNVRGTAVAITGTGFAADGTTPPTVTLGATSLTAVTFVNDTTLTATVPSGMTPGVYDLTVTNPDAGSASLTNAFTVTLPPTVSAIEPATAYNDIDTAVTITGTDFATDATGTVPPTASLASTPLTNVTFVSATTLTATVPWGMDPGTCDLTVTNPDGGSTSLTGAFTVGAGIGQWNPGDLFGGQMQQLLMKPGDPDTLYAAAYGVTGLFRSTDAGEQWTFVTDKVGANANGFAVDPLHPDWLYVVGDGLMRSQDEGDTWTSLMPLIWPDGRALQVYPQVHVSPYQDATHPQALFVSSCSRYAIPEVTGPKGLIKSVDGGVTWTIVASLEGVPVQDIAFDPNDHSHLVLVTADKAVYTSSDWGDSWTQITTSGLASSTLGMGGSIIYNPGGSEVWIDATAMPVGGGLFKCAATDLTSWKEVSPSSGFASWFLGFTSADSVYISRAHSTDGGTSWDPFGPSPWYGPGDFVFDPMDPQTAYITNDAVGVQKTTDLLDPTPIWQDKVQGLTALSCTSMAVSPTDPLRVYAAFYGPLGIYRSLDGTSHWKFLAILGSAQVHRVLVDPFDPDRVYAGADSGFYTSTTGGTSWTGAGWNLPPSSPSEGFVDMAADPYQPGHLLACFGSGGVPRLLYGTTDYGATWQTADVNPGPGLYNPHCIAFDPATPGTVYFATNGVYKSTDSGATWQRIDDLTQPSMAANGDITIATHPQHMVAVEGDSGWFYRSVDAGATWQKAESPGGWGAVVFVDGDSTRLYRATAQGLFFSSDAGDSWRRAAGALGQVQTTALGYALADGHAILYVATNGGHAGATGGTAAASPRRGAATTSTLVDAGVYRYVVVTPTLTLRLGGLSGGALRLGKRVTARGAVTPTSLAGARVTLTVQRKRNGHWRTVASVKRTIGAGGAYSWAYGPARTGAFRVRTSIAKSGTNMAARTTWRSFRVQ